MGWEQSGDERELKGYRAYLHLLARTLIGPDLRGQVDPSDIVQQAMLAAHRNRESFRGSSEAQYKGWLRAILANGLALELRRKGRRVGGLESDLERSSARLEAWLVEEQSSPSERAERGESLQLLSDALRRLPDDQRLALELRHLQGLPVTEVARRMGRTTGSVAGLLRRGGDVLRDWMSDRIRGGP